MDKRTVLIELSGKCTSGGALTLKTPPMDPGDIFRLDLVAVENDSTDNCLADVGVERSAMSYPLETVVMATHGRVYNYYHPVDLLSDDRVVVIFSAAGNAILCKAWVYGSLKPAGE